MLKQSKPITKHKTEVQHVRIYCENYAERKLVLCTFHSWLVGRLFQDAVIRSLNASWNVTMIRPLCRTVRKTFYRQWPALLQHPVTLHLSTDSTTQSQSQGYFTAGSLQTISSSWRQAPWSPRSLFPFLNWTLRFTIAAGPGQRSHSRVRVPRDSWPYFTLSDSRLPQPGGPGPRIYIAQEQGGPVPFSSPPRTRRAAVEIFEPASTRGSTTKLLVLVL
jgi:hypothetical protein